MQKFKSLNWKNLLNIIKCCLIGIISTLIGTVVFAVVLKFANLSSNFIYYINNVIKIFSIFIMVMCLKRKVESKLLLNAIISGVFYAGLTFIIFSLLSGQLQFNTSFLYDLLFCVIVSVISAIIVNIASRKTV